jgi:signal peptidase I
MTPTLVKGDVILISKLAYDIFGIDYKSPEPSNIITFEYNDELLIKRVKDVSSEGNVFVLGDNADNSVDSRDFGYIDYDNVDGRAIIKINFRSLSFEFLDD